MLGERSQTQEFTDVSGAQEKAGPVSACPRQSTGSWGWCAVGTAMRESSGRAAGEAAWKWSQRPWLGFAPRVSKTINTHLAAHVRFIHLLHAFDVCHLSF